MHVGDNFTLILAEMSGDLLVCWKARLSKWFNCMCLLIPKLIPNSVTQTEVIVMFFLARGSFADVTGGGSMSR